MKSIKIKKEYMDIIESCNENYDELINNMVEEIGDYIYKTNFPDQLEDKEYVDLEISDETFELLTKYSLINEESYDILINRLLIYSRKKEYDGSMLIKNSFRFENMFE